MPRSCPSPCSPTKPSAPHADLVVARRVSRTARRSSLPRRTFHAALAEHACARGPIPRRVRRLHGARRGADRCRRHAPPHGGTASPGHITRNAACIWAIAGQPSSRRWPGSWRAATCAVTNFNIPTILDQPDPPLADVTDAQARWCRERIVRGRVSGIVLPPDRAWPMSGIDLHLIGIGTGNPDHHAGGGGCDERRRRHPPAAQGRCEVRPDRSAPTIRATVLTGSIARRVRPARARDRGFPIHEVDDPHDAIAECWADGRATPSEGGRLALLVRGDPSLYDSSSRIAERLPRRHFAAGPSFLGSQVCRLTAAHARYHSNGLGAPVLVTRPDDGRLRDEGQGRRNRYAGSDARRRLCVRDDRGAT